MNMDKVSDTKYTYKHSKYRCIVRKYKLVNGKWKFKEENRHSKCSRCEILLKNNHNSNYNKHLTYKVAFAGLCGGCVNKEHV